MNKKNLLMGFIAGVWIGFIIWINFLLNIDLMAELQALPFYTLNAWAFWLSLLNTGLLVGFVAYVFRKHEPLKIVLVAQCNESMKVTQRKPSLEIENFECV